MIVVFSHPGDPHATRVTEVLGARGEEVLLLDLADLPGRASLSVTPTGPAQVTFRHTAGRADLTQASAVWWRRPQPVDLDAITDPAARGFAYGEWHEALHGAYALMRCPWMNPIHADEVASHKALQLALAPELGLRVPRTLMTSDADAAREFIADQEARGGRAIYKIFAATHEIWRETRLVGPADLAHLPSLHLAPVIFQEYVPAVADIRVTLVGDQTFAMAISGSPEIDFRLGLEQAQTGPFALPGAITEALQAMLARLGLVYGAVDLRLTAEGELVFLEINPAGEFLFVEAGAGHPVTEAVADWLSNPAAARAADTGTTACSSATTSPGSMASPCSMA